MNKTANITGIILSVLIIIGSMFKVQHWPGASVLIIFGTGLFMMVYLPLNLVAQLKKDGGGLNVALQIVFLFTMWLVLTGLMFKVQHWPGASVVFLGGIFALIVFFLPLFVAHIIKNQKSFFSVNLSIVLAFVAIFMLNNSKNFGKNLLLSSVVNEKAVATGNEGLMVINENVYTALANIDNADVQAKVKSVKESSAQTYQLVAHYKSELIKIVEVIPEDYSEEVTLEQVSAIDNYDIPTHVLFGGDVSTPNQGELSAYQLKQLVLTHVEVLLGATSNEKAQQAIHSLLDCKDPMRWGNRIDSWEISMFYHMPLATVICNLTALQNAVLISEGIALNNILATS